MAQWVEYHKHEVLSSDSPSLMYRPDHTHPDNISARGERMEVGGPLGLLAASLMGENTQTPGSVRCPVSRE